ncbi:Fumarate reductase flavoprotein subunit [Vibrio mangrovi]|uniref:Fumarate reductase flavoprotein subunit n=1 Tax=Vibrio mangrovi TaxID=474394 RepID=A0A1Y6IZM2_9VIBR|nr:Fumarate reductase flavoprotein subunit [Vibrio mangrovi]
MNYLKHSLAFYQKDAAPRIDYSDVTITKSQPKARLYGAAAEQAAAEEAQQRGEEN